MDKKIIDGVRVYYQLPEDVTDEQISHDLKGSLGEAAVNLSVATEDIKKAFGESMPNVFKKYFRS